MLHRVLPLCFVSLKIPLPYLHTVRVHQLVSDGTCRRYHGDSARQMRTRVCVYCLV